MGTEKQPSNQRAFQAAWRIPAPCFFSACSLYIKVKWKQRIMWTGPVRRLILQLKLCWPDFTKMNFVEDVSEENEGDVYSTCFCTCWKLGHRVSLLTNNELFFVLQLKQKVNSHKFIFFWFENKTSFFFGSCICWLSLHKDLNESKSWCLKRPPLEFHQIYKHTVLFCWFTNGNMKIHSCNLF